MDLGREIRNANRAQRRLLDVRETRSSAPHWSNPGWFCCPATCDSGGFVVSGAWNTGPMESEHQFDTCVEGVAALAALDVRAIEVREVAPRQLMSLATTIEAARVRLDALQGRVLAELDARGSTEALEGLTTKPWVARECGLDPRVAGRRIRVGKVLARHLPETERALAEGRISFDHAAVLAGACNDRNAAELREVEAHLIEEARWVGFAKWENLVRGVAATLDEDGSYDPDQDLERNQLSMAVVGDELVVKGALLGDGRVIVEQTIGHFADQLFRQYRNDEAVTGIAPPSRRVLQALALVEICRRARAVDLTATKPAAPEAVIVIDGSQLDEHVDAPQASDGEGNPLQPAGQPLGSVFKLACTATLRAVLMDEFGEPMDHGREIRNANRAQRRLLKVRDGGCVFPGCCAPAAWSDGHHIRWWHRDGGGTDIRNLLSLCRFHHGIVHRKGWGVRLDADGWAVFTRPDGHTFWGQRHGRTRAGPAPP